MPLLSRIGPGDFRYDQPHNESFYNNLEKLQYNVALAITGAIRGTSKLKIYEELCLDFFKLGFTPCKIEQPLGHVQLQEKDPQKD